MILKNARHELFAQAVASGKNPSEAYVLAGYQPDSGNASKLNTKASVRQRITEIQSAMHARSVKNASYGREWVLHELIDNVERAKAAEDFSAANTALRLLGVEQSMFVERKETGSPGDFAGLKSPGEVLDVIRRELGDAAAAAIEAALTPAQADDEASPVSDSIEVPGAESLN